MSQKQSQLLFWTFFENSLFISMFPFPFCILSWHVSQGQGLMGAQSLPDSPREPLGEWYSSSIHSPSSQIHPTVLPGTGGNKGPLQATCFHSLSYFGFHWSLVEQLSFYCLLVAFSHGYIFYILNFISFQGRICVSLEYLFEVLRFSSYNYKTVEACIWGKTFLGWKDISTLIVTVKGDFTAIHITSHPCSWHQSNLCCLSKRRLREIYYSVWYREGMKNVFSEAV